MPNLCFSETPVFPPRLAGEKSGTKMPRTEVPFWNIYRAMSLEFVTFPKTNFHGEIFFE
jgi:hypothetical protein